MKLLNTENEKEFKPFKLEIEIETIEEAKLLALVFANCNLRDKLCLNSIPKFKRNFIDDFNYKDRDEIYQYIISKIGGVLI